MNHTMQDLQALNTVEQLEEALSEPPAWLVEAFGRLKGDLMVLGVGGKMGPTLARMARRAATEAGNPMTVTGVSRFSNPKQREKLEAVGVETIQADLMDDLALAALPQAENVVYMAGMKFGSTGNEAATWAMNALLPGQVMKRFADSRIAAFSTGNVYGMTPLAHGGSQEPDRLNPEGEYAMSCLGRERMIEHFSQTQGTPSAIIRLNYACELRYGVLVDLAQKVAAGKPIDLTMGAFNVIWQTDANAMALGSLEYCDSPPYILNVAGPETLSTRRVCEFMADRMGRSVEFTGQESDAALLSNGQKGLERFGYPRIGTQRMIEMACDWVAGGGETLGKPTKFEVRDGRF